MYIRADDVVVAMVLDLSWPASAGDDGRNYAWHVFGRQMHSATVALDMVNTLTKEVRTVRMNHDEQVWVTGWGVQPRPDPEANVVCLATHQDGEVCGRILVDDRCPDVEHHRR